MNQSIFQFGIPIAAARCSKHTLARCLAVVVILMAATRTIAQDALVEARDLYRAAAYEDALVRLDTLRGSARAAGDGRMIEQYRAFCLIALGRTAEAERAIEAVVTAAPAFRPNGTEESPRVSSAFREVRRRLLPRIIGQQYTLAKAAFDRHDSSSARAGFQQVLDLLADADIASLADQPPLSELRTLATGFRDLSATPEPPPPASPPPPATASISHEPAPQPEPVGTGPYGIGNANVVPPVVVRESWAALADVFAVRTGVIEIVIDETGAVEAATMTTAVNGVYDRLAVTLAKRWRYKPATLDGAPVKFRKVIQLDLKTTR